MAYTYRVCMAYDHVYSMPLYKGTLYLATECKLITDCTAVVGVEYSTFIFNSDHQESSQPFILDCMLWRLWIVKIHVCS